MRTGTAALPSVHTTQFAGAVTRYKEEGYCCSSISPQNAFRVCSDKVPRGEALLLFYQPTERIIPGSGGGEGVEGG